MWHLGEDEGWDESDRELRYENLCIATHYGSYWDDYEKTHNKYGQVINEPVGRRLRGRTANAGWSPSSGCTRTPTAPTRASRSRASGRSASTATTGCPWCACFAVCSAWDNGVKGSGTAGVYNNVQLAKQGSGIYRGWTNDPSKVHAGDHAFIGSDHTGVIYDADDGTTIEGNTSNSGSQWNGGSVVKKTRGWGYWSAGFGIVDFPD